MNQRLYRSRTDRVIAGVAGGVAEAYDIDPSLVRILWVIFTPLTGFLLLVLYIVMMFVVPEAPAGWDPRRARPSYQPEREPWPSWGAQTPPPATRPSATGPSATAPPTDTAPGADDTTVGLETPTTGETAGFAEDSNLEGSAEAGEPTSSAPVGWAPPTASSSAPPPGWQVGSGWEPEREARWARREMHRSDRRDGTGAVIFGLLLVLVGGFFLLRTYVPDFDVDRAWPFAIIIFGAVLLIGSFRPWGDRRD